MATAMTQEEHEARLGEIQTRMQEIDTEFSGQALPEGAKDEFERLQAEKVETERLIKELETRRAWVTDSAEKPEAREYGFNTHSPRSTRGEDIYDLSTVRASASDPTVAGRELKDRAKRAVEKGHYPSPSVSQEEAQENVERLLDTIDTEDGALARRILQTGSPTYKRAFGKKLAGQHLSSEEERTLSLTDSAGGYAIPFTLDPSVIHTSNHSVNPFRAISRVVPVTGDNWNGVTSAGVSASYGAEATEASDGAPTLGQPSISVEKAQCFVPYSIEIGQDWSGLQGELTMMIQEAKDDLEATKFATGAGHGSNEPEGVLVGGTVTYTTAASATLAVADLYGTEAALPPRHRPRATWVANRSQYNRIRQFDTYGGAQLWTENLQVGLPNQVPTPGNVGARLLGYPAHELSTMGTTTAASSTIAIFGDFSRYVIVDRVGMSVELIPHLFGTASNYPTGQRGLYAYWRNSAEVVDANAFRKIIAKAS